VSPSSSPTAKRVELPADGVRLAGDLTLAEPAIGVVAFAHGTGSGRRSPRNRQVAAHLVGSSLSTMLLDLLTEVEETVDARTRELRFDIGLLARRFTAALDWLAGQEATAGLPIGCFGASTGAAAALIAAARRPDLVRAVVSRGGRPDLAGPELAAVTAPTLLIVGGDDPVVLDLNRQAQARLRCRSRLEVVEGATHLFEEPGALGRVADLACAWFLQHLPEH
jgi:putative phosphoribosyl transferase